MGADLQVFLSNEAWYIDPTVRPVYEDLVKALEKEFQRLGYSITVEQGSGNTIISIPKISEEGWDGALELVLSELRKRGLFRRGGCYVEFYRFEMNAPDKPRRLKPPHMRYSTQAYAVELARLRSALGSNDQEMLKAIEEKHAKEICRSDAWFSDLAHRQNRHGAPTVSEALAQIVGGHITGPDWAGSRYGYATELLCKHLGHWVGHGDLMGQIEHFDIPTHLAESGPPMPISGLPARPNICFLTAEQVREEYARLRNQDAPITGEDGASYIDDDPQVAREEFCSYLHQAEQRGLGLVTFRY